MKFKTGDEVITVKCKSLETPDLIGLRGKLTEKYNYPHGIALMIEGYPDYEFFEKELRLLTKLEKAMK